ncbi:uncharacterized protein BJ171DRAFT_426770 [Polychytrium aggregatum]|uniref:uncharacterized protein n=1 Tax=Polychytrium aggregatum TaxID=110093 RepID=UPI0022FE1C6D|nr:uncharacterized protein BJ171DRAFT_426770 [Polychytrium aggregatum]KAI9202146.1 hypothetical protein BJ171DRAFT_426770 [Polychytrium aggregatum]
MSTLADAPAGKVASSFANTANFDSFKKNYLLVYSLVMMSDWLQGPYIYQLYRDYGYDLNDIAILFITGFLSSAVLGTVVGSIADRVGRKTMCLAFCVVYTVSCLTKLSPAFSVLLLGRVTGGVATSLLFSTFEAWMVSEHFSRGFKDSLLSDTFSWATFLNGLVAIISGVLANFLANIWGPVSPFMASIVFQGAAAAVISTTWSENYGSEKPKASSSSLKQAISVIFNDSNIRSTGLMQTFFESAMYTFVFLWSPVLENITPTSLSLPYGIIFAAFMVSIMIGSVIFRVLNAERMSHKIIARNLFLAAGVSLVIPALFIQNATILFAAFNLFELCCGIYYPTLGTIRSKVIPEEIRATVMNIFRVPLNLIVVVTLLKVKDISQSLLFVLCAASVIVAAYYATIVSVQTKDVVKIVDKDTTEMSSIAVAEDE